MLSRTKIFLITFPDFPILLWGMKYQVPDIKSKHSRKRRIGSVSSGYRIRKKLVTNPDPDQTFKRIRIQIKLYGSGSQQKKVQCQKDKKMLILMIKKSLKNKIGVLSWDYFLFLIFFVVSGSVSFETDPALLLKRIRNQGNDYRYGSTKLNS